MKLQKLTFIFLGSDFDPQIHRTVVKTESMTYTMIGLSFTEKARVIELARTAVKEGAQMIELCGGFGPVWIAQVIDAIEGVVPVGGVFYGPEARKGLLDLGLMYDKG